MQTKLTNEQRAALERYARVYGRTWKSKLNTAWFNGTDSNEPDGCYLRQVRNLFGPSWLIKFQPRKEA